MSKSDNNYKERIEKYLFKDNWIEPPLFHNNSGKVLRFDLESKPETKSTELIKNIFDDLFFKNSEMFVIFYGSIDNKWQTGKKYFKFFSLKRIMQKSYVSKCKDDQEDKPYLVVCLTKRNKFNFKKYLLEYLEDKQTCQMAFISLKKGTTIQLYDSRGFDLLSLDKVFLNLLYKNYEEYVIEYNKKEIIDSLTNQTKQQ